MISRKILAVCAVLLMVGAFASMASASSLNGTQSFTKAEVAPLFIADPLTDLVLTPLNPCRIIDTRSGGGPIAANTQRTFSATTSSFTAQGGSATPCGVPTDATALVVNFVSVTPAGSGDLRAFPFGSAVPNSSVLNYQAVSGLNIANGVIIKTCNRAASACGTNDFTIQADGSATDLVADVQGFFRKVAPQDGVLFAGAHITGNATTTPSVDKSFNKLLPATPVTVSRGSAGTYTVDFGANILSRYYMAAPGNSAGSTPAAVTCTITNRSGNVNAVFVQCFDAAGTSIDSDYWVQIF